MLEYAGEDGDDYSRPFSIKPTKLSQFCYKERLKEKILSFDEASQALSMLGKNANGRYSYLKISLVGMSLTDVSVILTFKFIMFVDISKNLLKLDDIQVLCDLPFMTNLKADQNLIDSAALKPAKYLQVLQLNTNLITETCDIKQPDLEVLELGNNLIYTIQFDSEGLIGLKELSLHGNHLIDTSGTFPYNIEKLYLGANKITKINSNFSLLPNLTVLHLRQNNIKKLNGLDNNLNNLTYLNLRSNNITKMREFKKLQSMPKLDTLIVIDNPIENHKEDAEEEDEEEAAEEEIKDEASNDEKTAQDETMLRLSLLVLLPRLKRINKAYVTFEERDEAEMSRKKLFKEIFEEESSEDDTEQVTTDNTTDYTSETGITKEGEKTQRTDEVSFLDLQRYNLLVAGEGITPDEKSLTSMREK